DGRRCDRRRCRRWRVWPERRAPQRAWRLRVERPARGDVRIVLADRLAALVRVAVALERSAEIERADRGGDERDARRFLEQAQREEAPGRVHRAVERDRALAGVTYRRLRARPTWIGRRDAERASSEQDQDHQQPGHGSISSQNEPASRGDHAFLTYFRTMPE